VKASASILASFAVGALVCVVLVGRGTEAAAVVPARMASSIVEPRLEHPVALVPREAAGSGAPLISIPRIQLKARVGTNLDDGPAWWPVTGRPGRGDTVAIAGHRTTHTRPFYWLERLRPGDAVYVRWAGRMHAYRVSGRRILSAKDLHIADARGHEVLLLSACTPRGSARQRIVVYAWPREP
jgi:sortase A